jgi:hypothetical protein
MATLGNILKRQGGTPLTGRPVTFHLVVRDDEAGRVQHKIDALLMPVGEEDRVQVIEDARAFCESIKKPQLAPIERDLRFLAAAMRDPEAPGNLLIDGKEALAALRSGLIKEQIIYLGTQYDLMLQEQYPELAAEPQPVTEQETAAMRKEAIVFSKGDPR